MRRVLIAVIASLLVASLIAPVAAGAQATGSGPAVPKVVIIVGPTSDQTAQYREFADEEAAAAHLGNRKPRPQRIPSLHEAASLLDRASQVIDRIHRQRADNAISRADLMRVMQEMGRVVQRHVTDGATLDKIKDDWLAIRVA